MDGMNIYYNYTVEVNNTEHMATLKEGDIHLYIGDKNIDYYFKVEKAQFTFRGTSETESLIESTMPSKAAVSVLKPNGDIVIGSEAEVVGSRIKWTVTPDLIDEDVEVGDFTLAISLIESSTDSMATLPPITNQVHIHERVTPTPGSSLNAVVNEAVVGLAQVQSDDTALDVFDSEGNYIKTVWKSGDKITQTKLNKIEDGLSGLSTQFKDIANEVNNLKEHGTGTIPNNVALLEDVTVDGETEDYIPLMALNGTEYRLTINNLGVPVVKNINGDIVFTCGTGSSGGSGDTPSTPIVPEGSWVSGVAYSDFGWIDGYYVDKGNGQDVSSSGWSISEYMNCEGADYIEGWCENAQYNAFYTSSKEFISAFAVGGASPSAVKVPTNASYFRLSNENSKLSEVTITPYKKIDGTWSDGVPYNLELIANKYYSNGNLTDYNGWSATNYVNCSYASKLNILSPNGGITGSYCSFFDLNKKAIPNSFINVTQTTDGIPVEITVPINACYFVLSAETTTMTGLTVTPIA